MLDEVGQRGHLVESQALRQPRHPHGQPWAKAVAGRPGEYVPNNHVLHTILAKVAYGIGGPAAGPPREWVLRLPAWVAASLLPVAVAWPVRRRRPAAALAVAVVVAGHPWLVALGSEARGYPLMLLLGVVATNLLPGPAAAGRSAIAGSASAGTRAAWRAAGYAVTLAGAIYTVPLAVLLVPAHAAAVGATRRPLGRWALSVALAGLLTVGLYLPMARGLADYYRHPYPATMHFPSFIEALPQTALAGNATGGWALSVGSRWPSRSGRQPAGGGRPTRGRCWRRSPSSRCWAWPCRWPCPGRPRCGS